MADLRINSIPNFDTNYVSPSENPDNQYKIQNSIVQGQYGISVQINSVKKFNDHFRWECYSRGFANAIHPNKINFDIKNLFIVNPLKYFSISFTTRHFYSPENTMPYIVKQRYELLIGIEF